MKLDILSGLNGERSARRAAIVVTDDAQGQGLGRLLFLRLVAAARAKAKKDNLPRVLGGLGVAIISTSGGLLTDKQAKKRGVGGEVLAYVW